MKRGWLLVILTVGLAIAFASGAGAQYFPSPEETGLGYSIAVGAAFPVNGDVDTSAAPSVSVAWYAPLGEEFGENATIGISGDWTAIDRLSDGKTVHIFPVLINYKQYGIIIDYRVFVNFGIGVIGASDNIPEMMLDDGANFGWTGGMGVDLTNNLFGQVRFIGGENPGDDGLVSVQIGYRF